MINDSLLLFIIPHLPSYRAGLERICYKYGAYWVRFGGCLAHAF